MEQMEHYLFKQLKFVRSQTLKQLDGVTEEMADRVPEGFRNTIRWNLGHVYVVLERYIFQYLNLPQQLPAGFKELFEFRTSPLDWQPGAAIPTLAELEQLLSGQLERVEAAIANRLHETLPQPYTTSTGLTIESPEQFCSINLFHEGMHLSVIKLYKTFLSRS
ncbi:DinB family protein [Paenibacillus taihuensis]|uniref:DinB family protein n=1 Tax=Paenibacillus taihuensis TaxID=1156355 RepID=A0A3D9R1H3_9BACL|nr:DinB family protein [Paenibacillus taihuensis]REE68676.1 DinB family protein [Paenibacillus taihuensis]